MTRDGFLGGRVQVWQPRVGYRAATDPVFLAAACPAVPKDSVLELGCGVGVASLCLAVRVPGVDVLGVERQRAYADLARRNGLPVVDADLTRLPEDIRQRSFDHVIANPPYFVPGAGTRAEDEGREAALREQTPLRDWLAVARARLRQKGWLTLIHQAERLPDILSGLEGFGTVAVMPLSARDGRPAGRVVMRARKGGRGPFTLLPPLLIHEGTTHAGDGDDYSATARAVLRNASALPFG
nr:methyltransferase [Hasllibacter sp. MH4015]